jgi:hypothetical protein
MKRALIVASSIALVFAAFLAVPASAVEPYSLTFSAPVQVPGAMLPPGTYQFRPTIPRVMQVMSGDHAILYATFMTIPRYRLDSTAEAVVVFEEAPTGVAPSVKIWFPPYEHTGFEFVYAKPLAGQFAQLR